MTSVMPKLPSNMTAYKKTPIFSQESIPKGLQKEHSTAEGVWAVINILSGSMLYSITEAEQEAVFRLDTDNFGVIAENQRHHVQADGPVSFFVEFYRAAF